MLIATFSAQPDAFALERTLDEVPGMHVQSEHVAAHSTEWVMPCLWIAEAAFDDVTAALEDDPTVQDIVEVEQFTEEAFYHLEWSDEVEQRINTMVDKEGSILDASVTEGTWQIRIRFASRDQLDAFCEHFTGQGGSFHLIDLSNPDTPHQVFGKLTASQRDALVTATEHGYFEVPREMSATDLAEELDISHQAVSELLRRGIDNLITATLTAQKDQLN